METISTSATDGAKRHIQRTLGRAAKIISASRRTDIPRYFGRWFAERRREGVAEFRNVFGGKGSASLRDEDVLGFLFWTKYAGPFAAELQALRNDGVPFVFQYTITGYGRDVEPHVTERSRAIDDFLAVSQALPSPACIQWRYDPIILSGSTTADFHRRNFGEIADALEGATRVVNVSIVEPYQKAIRRLLDPSVLYRRVDPSRHKTVAKRYPDLPQVGSEIEELLRELAELARDHGMELRSCSNPEWSLPRSQCSGLALFTPYGEQITTRVAALRSGPSRDACRCVEVVDIGMDNTCLAGCKYCYVVTSHDTAVKNFERHDPAHRMLR